MIHLQSGPADRVRLLVVHPRDLAAPTQGGIQTFLHDLVKYAPADFDITIAGVTADRRARPIGRLRELSIEGRRAWTLPLAPQGRMSLNPLDLVRMARAQLVLRRMMRDRQTILQVHRPYRRILLAGHRGPRVQFVHLDLRAWPGPSGWARFNRLYQPFSHGQLLGMAKVFVANEPGVELLKRDRPEIAERVEFLPVWYDGQVFRPPVSGERAERRAALAATIGAAPFDDGEALVLVCGRLDDNKDPTLAVEAFARLVADGTRARLLIAGDGEEKAAVMARLGELGMSGQAHLMGDLSRDELATTMRATDALLLTSHAEGGGPRVVLEALASGVPVVATTVGDVARTVTTGVNGWLTDGRDPAALARGLAWAIEQPRAEVARAAIEAVAPYSATNVLKRVYDVYRALARDGNAASRRANVSPS